MLNSPTPFPYNGSAAFVATTDGRAQPVTIVRHNADDTFLVRYEPDPPHSLASDRDLRGASGNGTIELSAIFATREEAAAAAAAKLSRKRKAA